MLWKRLEILQNPQKLSKALYFQVFDKEWLLVIKYFLFKIERYFRALKMNFVSKFGARVSFYTAILQSWKF